MCDMQDVSRKRVLCKMRSYRELRIVYFYSRVDVCDVWMCTYDLKIEDETIRKIEPSKVFFHDGRYIYIFREATFLWVFFLFIFFSFVTLFDLAWLRLVQQWETTRTINDFFRRWANLCVSCELLLYFLRFIHFLFVFLFCAVPRDRELPLLSHFLFYMIEDILLLFRALFYVIEDILSSLYVLFSVEDGGCTCTCVSVPSDTLRRSPIFSSFRERVTPSLSLHKQSEPSPRKLDFPLVTAPFFRYYTHFIVCVFFVGRIPSTFLSPLALVRVASTSYTFLS